MEITYITAQKYASKKVTSALLSIYTYVYGIKWLTNVIMQMYFSHAKFKSFISCMEYTQILNCNRTTKRKELKSKTTPRTTATTATRTAAALAALVDNAGMSSYNVNKKKYIEAHTNNNKMLTRIFYKIILPSSVIVS